MSNRNAVGNNSNIALTGCLVTVGKGSINSE